MLISHFCSTSSNCTRHVAADALREQWLKARRTTAAKAHSRVTKSRSRRMKATLQERSTLENKMQDDLKSKESRRTALLEAKKKFCIAHAEHVSQVSLFREQEG